MVIPWVGIPLSSVLKRAEPTGKATFVEFTTLLRQSEMPGQSTGSLDWPYVEGLRLDEAMHPLTILAVGLYGKTLMNQNGAPLRLVVPWKYGFKSAKSIVKIRFVEKEPGTAWNKAAAAGKVVGVGAPIEGATEGWYVPRYLVEGEGAKAPKLKSIADLGQYAELFRDPEEPGKGRFYNCPAGWTCELENTQMLQSYGLSDKYTNFRPGTGPALDAAIVSATKRKQPILTYYWSPTPLLGRVDMVQLKPRDGEAKRIQVQAGLSKPFHDGAPELVAVLSRVNVPIELLNRTLAEQADAKQDAPAAAKALLKAHPELWQAWVTDAAARSKIQAAL